MNEADAYLDSLDRDDLQGIEIDVLRLASFTSGLDDTCAAGVSACTICIYTGSFSDFRNGAHSYYPAYAGTRSGSDS